MITPEEFRIQWKPDEISEWCEFDNKQIEASPLTDSTKQFLKHGFPLDAAPFLSFGWGRDGRFLNIAECYPRYGLKDIFKNYWILGSDDAGNPICFDVSRNDAITLHDHEQRFEIIETVNSNVAEFAECLLIYKNFIEGALDEGDSFSDLKFSQDQILALKADFERINSDILKKSAFWRSEIKSLAA